VNLARAAAALAVLVTAGTYVAAQVDYVRRHQPGISPERYLLPQLTHIWLPGLAIAAALAGAAFVLRRRGPRA
jgi:hypothetical protein